MYKSLVLFCVVFCVVIEARPKWQFLPPKPGYVPVYIRAGDTPLEEINLDLAEAFHALPAGRSAGKLLDASPENPDQPDSNIQADEPQPDMPDADEPKHSEEPKKETPETPESTVDRRPYEKKFSEKKTKKATEIAKPVERR